MCHYTNLHSSFSETTAFNHVHVPIVKISPSRHPFAPNSRLCWPKLIVTKSFAILLINQLDLSEIDRKMGLQFLLSIQEQLNRFYLYRSNS
jgi:hypothetical protein